MCCIGNKGLNSFEELMRARTAPDRNSLETNRALVPQVYLFENTGCFGFPPVLAHDVYGPEMCYIGDKALNHFDELMQTRPAPHRNSRYQQGSVATARHQEMLCG